MNKKLYTVIGLIIIVICVVLFFVLEEKEKINDTHVEINLIKDTSYTLENSKQYGTDISALNEEIYHEFEINCTNVSNKTINYDIILNSDNKELDEYIYVQLVDSSNGNIILKPTKLIDINNILYSNKVNGGELTYTKSLKIKIWLNSNNKDKSIKTNINLELKEK